MRKPLLILCSVLATLLSANGEESPLSIKTNQDGAVQYCTEAFNIVPNLTIEGTPTLTSLKISVSEGYIQGQDTLFIEGSTGNIKSQWYDYQGYLTLSGNAGVKEFEEAVRLIRYRNNSATPTVGSRKITISLNDADYLPKTGHFYRYIPKPGIYWTDAKAEAESDEMKLFGLKGYLATITLKEEDDFIRLKTNGMGWIGASDTETENLWKWVTGPEGLNGGMLFWRGTGEMAKRDPANNGIIEGFYHNWHKWNDSNPTNGYEPNQNGDEDYGHISMFTDNTFGWNDLPNVGHLNPVDNSGKKDPYYPQGYIIEYGDMPGDPEVNLTATIELQVNTVSFSSKRDFTTCSGDTIRLNQKDYPAVYQWLPNDGTLSDPTLSNPVAKALVPTVYSVVATRGICQGSAEFTVNANPLPVSLLRETENICKGDILTLDPGTHTGYAWSTGASTRTIEVNEPGKYLVRLTTDKNCTLKDSVQVSVHEYPKLDLTQLDTLICGEKMTTLAVTADKGVLSLESPLATIDGLKVTVNNYGTYPILLKATDQYSCTTDTAFTVGFHKTPTVGLMVDAEKCQGYNLDALYQGDADLDITRFIWIFGNDTVKNEVGAHHEIIPLGINKADRNLELKVVQQGCENKTTLSNLKVIPLLSLTGTDTLGCEPFTASILATNTENVAEYNWEWGDNTNPEKKTDGNGSHTYMNDGFYNVKLTVTTDEGCSNWVKIDSMVYVAPIPTAGFSLSPDECLNAGENQVSYLGSADDQDHYQWDLSAFDADEIITDPLTTQGPFIFDLKNKPQATIGLQVISKYNCVSKPATILVKRKPIFDFTASSLLGCTPLQVNFEAAAIDPIDQLDFNWDFGDGATDIGSETDHIYRTPAQEFAIALRATSTLTGCSNQTDKPELITTHPNPVAAFELDHPIVYNDNPVVKFTNLSSSATDYLWNFSDQGSSTEENPEHRFAGTGAQHALLTAYNEFLCSDTLSQSILVAFNKIFPPNAFSPNAPKEIDRQFRLYSPGIKDEGYHLRIMSRWNDIVFETENEIVGWDGKTKNGQNASPGNYIWVLEYVDFLDRRHRQSGAVTLIY